ncbi:DUF2569 domain-containing protein [Sphingomonas sp. GCM10030256]|uniref:DUF2569 domain-containing protein n=1 Tax=Sphingomonas sp. GCM10030256 TaxID=3273427 RepID=UPI00361F5E0D
MLNHPTVNGISQALHARSAALLVRIEDGLPRIVLLWMAAAALASAARIAVSPFPASRIDFLPYVLLVVAPAASLLLALHWFRDGAAMAQPSVRLARVGRWREVPADEARRHPLFGTSGIMVSLLVGMLLNVPVRAAEYLATMPAIGAAAPEWLATLHLAMSIDAVLVSSLYVIAFAAALRGLPLFPRLLVLVWLVDLAMQLLIAQAAVSSGLPSQVAGALLQFLDGNIKKVLISVALWLPYLLLSARVNVTFRQRVAV